MSGSLERRCRAGVADGRADQRSGAAMLKLEAVSYRHAGATAEELGITDLVPKDAVAEIEEDDDVGFAETRTTQSD